MMCSVRVLIIAVTVFIVIIVACVSVGITYGTSLTALQALGEKHVNAIAATGTQRITAFLGGVESSIYSFVDNWDVPTMTLPNETFTASQAAAAADPANAQSWFDYWGALARQAVIASNFSSDLTIKFEDGTALAAGIRSCYEQNVMSIDWINGSTRDNTWNAGGSRYRIPTTEYLGGYADPNNNTYMYCGEYPLASSRTDSYMYGANAAGLLTNKATCLWYPSVYVYMSTVFGIYEDFFMTALCGMANPRINKFTGTVTSAFSQASFGTVLSAIRATENTKVFLVDGNGLLCGTSESGVNLVTSQRITSTTYVPMNCIDTVISMPNIPLRMGCRPTLATYPYAPLNALPVKTFALTSSSTGAFMRTRLDGTNYYSVSTRIVTPLGFTGQTYNLICILPETDIMGQVYTARDIAIGIVCAVLVLSVIGSSILVTRILAPLEFVARRMQETAALQDDSDDMDIDSLDDDHGGDHSVTGSGSGQTKGQSAEGRADGVTGAATRGGRRATAAEHSPLAEIDALLTSYTQMRTAIRSFTRYVPRDVVRELVSTNELCRIAMKSMRCSMLFCDIARFTDLCEHAPPQLLSRAVRVYFGRMSRLVLLHGGIVDKFIGDCVMAVWGAPQRVSFAEIRAALCALAFHRATLREPLLSAFSAMDVNLNVRVGVASGEVLAGNMGSPDRMSYTVIGDAVNLAARLESFNKQWGTHVMLAEDIVDEAQDILLTRMVVYASVVGRATPLGIYDIVGVRSDAVERAEGLRGMKGDTAPSCAGASVVPSSVGSGGSDNDDATSSAGAFYGEGLGTSGEDAVKLKFSKLVRYHVRHHVADPEDTQFAERYTAAATALREMRFAEAADALGAEIANGTVPSRPSFDATRSVQVLHAVAETLTHAPPPSDEMFDGEYAVRAFEK
jgi:class 3 adenylate cyclase